MHPPSLPQISTLLALGDRATLALDLEELSLGVVAGGSPVSLDARFAGEGVFRQWGGEWVWGRDGRSTKQTFFR